MRGNIQFLGLPLIGLLGFVTGCSESRAEDAVKQELTDPDSAQFSNVNSKGDVVCGLVNSKNRLGGYVGPVGFIVQNGTVLRLMQVNEIFPGADFDRLCPSESSHAIMAAHVDRYNREAAESRGF